MQTKSLLADPSVLRLDKMVVAPRSLTIFLHSVQTQVRCPLCQQLSAKRHSCYQRPLADLPWQAVPVTLQLSVRRFFCLNVACHRQVFAERLAQVVADFARKTRRLNDALTALAFALGGAAGHRLAEQLGLLSSADTLLRRMRQAAAPPKATPRVLGMDDFAFRKRHTYGTIPVDLETHAPVDVLPERESQTVAAWLHAHPGVEIVARDRSPVYAEGIAGGAPSAVQVADRWHLLKNLREVVERILNRQRRALRVAAHLLNPYHSTQVALKAQTLPPLRPKTRPPQRSVQELQRQTERREERLARYHEIRQLHAAG